MTTAAYGELFDAADAEFARWSPLLWQPMGEATAARGGIAAGDQVLDVCCGAGASAIPAARAAGVGGHVDAIDLSASLLQRGRAAAEQLGLSQLTFSHADATTWVPPEGDYDVVQCAYGVFFFPDMDSTTQRLAGLLRPGGRLTVTTWDQAAITAIGPALGQALAVQGRTLQRPPSSVAAARIHSQQLLTDWLYSLGLSDITVTTIDLAIPIDGNRAWSFVLGTGLRSFLDGLAEHQLDTVRAEFAAGLAEAGIDSLNTTSHIGVGVRR